MFCSSRTCLIAFFLVLTGLFVGLIVTTVLYTTADESKYATNCTVAEVGNKCYLVYPYAYNQTYEYKGDVKSCDRVGQLVTCYFYKGQEGGDIDNGIPGTPFTGVTTNPDKARTSDYSVLFGLVLAFAVMIFFFVITAIGMVVFRHYPSPRSEYSQL